MSKQDQGTLLGVDIGVETAEGEVNPEIAAYLQLLRQGGDADLAQYLETHNTRFVGIDLSPEQSPWLRKLFVLVEDPIVSEEVDLQRKDGILRVGFTTEFTSGETDGENEEVCREVHNINVWDARPVLRSGYDGWYDGQARISQKDRLPRAIEHSVVKEEGSPVRSNLRIPALFIPPADMEAPRTDGLVNHEIGSAVAMVFDTSTAIRIINAGVRVMGESSLDNMPRIFVTRMTGNKIDNLLIQ